MCFYKIGSGYPGIRRFPISGIWFPKPQKTHRLTNEDWFYENILYRFKNLEMKKFQRAYLMEMYKTN